MAIATAERQQTKRKDSSEEERKEEQMSQEENVGKGIFSCGCVWCVYSDCSRQYKHPM